MTKEQIFLTILFSAMSGMGLVITVHFLKTQRILTATLGGALTGYWVACFAMMLKGSL